MATMTTATTLDASESSTCQDTESKHHQQQQQLLQQKQQQQQHQQQHHQQQQTQQQFQHIHYQQNDKQKSDYCDYRSEGGPKLEYLWSSDKLQGQSLYLGGEEGLNGTIYCIPGHAERVLCIQPNDDVHLIGPIFPGKFKWLRGIRVGPIIYGLPCHADSVLRIDTSTNHVTTLPIPYQEFYGHDTDCNDTYDTHNDDTEHQRTMTWKYHGGSLTCDNVIYAIPQSAHHVLRIEHDKCSFVPSLPLVGRYKWYGGVYQNGAVYGIPQNSSSVLRIACQEQEDQKEVVTFIPVNDATGGGHKWHGASVSPTTGIIVCVPNHANSVLCIDTKTKNGSIFQLQSSDIATGRHRSDEKYKYLGAMVNPLHPEVVYCIPSGAEYVLRVNTANRTVTNVGPNVRTVDGGGGEIICQNKWQNGLVSGKSFLYAIPLAAQTVLQMDAKTEKVTLWPLPMPQNGLAKWEGGVTSSRNNNNDMYCMPNNFKAVLKITAPTSKRTFIKEEEEKQT